VEALTAIDRALAEKPADRPPDPARLAIPDLGARSPELKQTRELIDAVDRELVDLLARRAELAQRAAQAKAELGQPVLDAAREAAMLDERRVWANAVGLEEEGLREIFAAILRWSRRTQRKGS
jgi:prephenate dehydrogenase